MSDDLFCLKVLNVSRTAEQSDVLRRAASLCSAPVEIDDADTSLGAASVAASIARGAFDVVFVDLEIPRPTLQKLLDGAHASGSNPLAIFVGPSDARTRAVLTHGLDIDGGLLRPIDPDQATALLESCVRARLQCRALIVDDSSTVRSVIRKVVQASRYRLTVDEAVDGAAAIEMTSRERFDIVFLNCNMPGIDGFAALDAIRNSNPDGGW